MAFVHSSLHAVITKKFPPWHHPCVDINCEEEDSRKLQLPISLLFATHFHSSLAWAEKILLSERFRGTLCNFLTGRDELAHLQWALRMACPYDSEQCLQTAAREGNLPMLQWMTEQQDQQQIRGESSRHRCKKQVQLVLKAASGGHLEVIRWLRAQGCPWNEYGTVSTNRTISLSILPGRVIRFLACLWLCMK